MLPNIGDDLPAIETEESGVVELQYLGEHQVYHGIQRLRTSLRIRSVGHPN